MNTQVLPRLSASMSILDARDLFEISPDVTYLKCANMAPQLKLVTQAGIDAVHAKVSLEAIGARVVFRGG